MTGAIKGARSLGLLQSWMQGEIARPRMSGDAAIARIVSPSPRLTSRERLSIYADMIRLRLADCLRQDFPGVAHAVGAERFDELCEAYVERHPSRHYSLNVLGARFAEFLREGAGLRKLRVFLAELAQLERAVQDAFDSPMSTALRGEQLLGLPQERLASLRLELAPGVRLIATTYAVDEFLQAVYDGRKPRKPVRKRSWTLVYRRDLVVWRARLDRERFTLLGALRDGKTLGEALETCAALPGVDAAKLGASVSGWFEEWAAEGVFVGGAAVRSQARSRSVAAAATLHDRARHRTAAVTLRDRARRGAAAATPRGRDG
jgi:hypothetical protein